MKRITKLLPPPHGGKGESSRRPEATQKRWLVSCCNRWEPHAIEASRETGVTVAGHPADDLHPKTLKNILTQAGLKK
jgi:hypothetical protein